MKRVLLLAGFLVWAICAPAQVANCWECTHNSFGDAICFANQHTCGCECYTINKPGAPHICILYGDCIGNHCQIQCESPTSNATQGGATRPSPSTAQMIAAHPWVTDTTTTDNLRVHFRSMAGVFEAMQQTVKEKHWTNARGVLNEDINPDGAVTYELITRDNGISEIRLAYIKTNQQERLVITPDQRWILFRAVPNADHVLHNEVVTQGEITAVPAK